MTSATMTPAVLTPAVLTPRALTAAALVGAMVLSLAACTSAASPDRIQPAYVSSLSFQKMSCRQLAAAKANNDAALAKAVKQQSQAYASDAVSGFVIGVSVATMAGQDIGPEVARLKGEQAAISDVRKARKCG